MLKQHQLVYSAGVGFADLESQIAPDEDTVFHIASLTKSITATASMLLIDEEKIDANAPINTIIPEFRLQDDWVSNHTTIIDMLANRAGIAGRNGYWSQPGNRCHLKKKDLVSTLGSGKTV